MNWQESVVDLMKLLGLDSSLGMRKRLAEQWGYDGRLDGSAAMNTWLHREIVRRFEEQGGNVLDAPEPPGGDA